MDTWLTHPSWLLAHYSHGRFPTSLKMPCNNLWHLRSIWILIGGTISYDLIFDLLGVHFAPIVGVELILRPICWTRLVIPIIELRYELRNNSLRAVKRGRVDTNLWKGGGLVVRDTNLFIHMLHNLSCIWRRADKNIRNIVQHQNVVMASQ